MQNYKTSQVGGRASKVGGIACIFKVRKKFRIVRDGGNPSKVAVAITSIMNIKLKLLVIESRIKHLQ